VAISSRVARSAGARPKITERGQGDAQRERDDPDVHREIDDDRNRQYRQERLEEHHQPPGKRDADRRREREQRGGLGEELRHQLPTAGAYGQARRDLAPARHPPRQQHGGHVAARDREHHCRQEEQHADEAQYGSAHFAGHAS
jgi:hypothetical protein